MTGTRQIDYLRQGIAADRPAAPDAATNTLSFYYATDTLVLSYYDWNAAAWVTITGASIATTTEVLTGTNTTKAVSPDALAALWEKGSDISSAATISVGEGGFFHVTGTTTITDIDFATDKSGRGAILVFDGALTLTYNATSLILPGAANIATAAGDCCRVVSEDGSNNVRVVWYQRASGQPLIPTAFSGARVQKAANQTAADYSAGVIMAFDQEVFDAGGWHDNVTNNSRLTVPTGIVRVRFTWNVHNQLGTAGQYRGTRLYKNGAQHLQVPTNIAGNAEMGINGSSGWLDTVATDYWELWYFSGGDTSITIVAADTWFEVEGRTT